MDKKELIKEMLQAVQSGSISGVEAILEKNSELLYEEIGLGNWMYRAVERKQYAMLDYLLEKGMDINRKSGRLQLSAIEVAVLNNDIEMVSYLIKKGGDLNGKYDASSTLINAIGSNNFELVKLLIEFGADYISKYQIDSEKMNPSGYARKSGYSEIAEYIESLSESSKSNYVEKVPHTVSFRRSKAGINYGKLEEFFCKAIRESFPKIKQKYQDDHLIKISYAFDTKSTDVNYRYICDICVQTQKNMDIQIGNKPDFEWAFKYEIDSWGLYEHEIEEFFNVQKYLLQHGMNFEKIMEMEDVDCFLSEMNKYDDEILHVLDTFSNAVCRARKEGILRNSDGEEVYVYPYTTEDDHQKDFVPLFKKMNEGLEQADYLENINLFMNE